jgi:Holliday junction DNA helicase RuvB
MTFFLPIAPKRLADLVTSPMKGVCNRINKTPTAKGQHVRAVQTFHGFAGQAKITAALSEQIAGALRAGTPLPHVLLSGTSGSGKTHLSRAVAGAMGTKLHELYCSDQTTRALLAELLAKVNTADCVYLDEVHALRESVQELLYPAVDRQKVPVVQDGRVIDGQWLDIHPFTLILSTDQPAKTRNALLQRVPLRFHLGRYTEREMRVIVQNYASDIGILLSTQALTRLAQVSRGLPRTAHHRLLCLKTAIGTPDKAVTRTQVERHLELHGIDVDNLTAQDRTYLSILAGNRGAPVSLQTMALRMGMDDFTLRREVETYLTLRGWVSIEPRGRCLTDMGVEFVRSRGFTE